MTDHELRSALAADDRVLLELQRREEMRARRRKVYGEIAIALVWGAVVCGFLWAYVTVVLRLDR